MQIKRIELNGATGHVAIERDASAIRIDSIVRDPARGQQAWKTWELNAAISDDDLYKVATEIYQRIEGRQGSNSDVHDLFREMQRFQD